MKDAYSVLSIASFVLGAVNFVGDRYEPAFFFLMTAILFAIYDNGEAEGNDGRNT